MTTDSSSDGIDDDLEDQPENSDRCGAKCRDGSICHSYSVEGSERCRMHGGASPGAPKGNQNSARHGLYSDPANVLDDLAEKDPEGYDWILKKYDSYLDDAPFEDGSAKADQLKQICVQEFIIWRASGLQLENGIVVATNEPEGNKYGDRIKDHPVNKPLDRMQRTVTSRLKELGILDDPESQQANAEGDKVAALRDLMGEADKE